MRRLVIVPVILLSLAAQDKLSQKSYMGKAPPAIKVKKDALINAKADLNTDALKGRVVWIEFGFTH